MSEADLIASFHGAVNLNSDIFFGYVSLMSAFLVMCYLAARKLPIVLASIVLALFSVVSALLILRLFLNGNDAAALMAHMLEQQRLGNLDLAGFGSNPLPVRLVSSLEILSTVGGYIGCMAFFFYRRMSVTDDAAQTTVDPEGRKAGSDT